MPAKFTEEVLPSAIAVGFMSMAATIFELQIKPLTLFAVWTSAYVVYYADHALPKKTRGAWPVILLLSGVFFISAWKAGQFSLPVSAAYVLLAFTYIFPWFPRKKRLQDYQLLRVIAVALAWAALPVIFKGFTLDIKSCVYVVGMMTFMIPAIIWSDLSDEKADRLDERLTFSVQLSSKQRKYIMVISLLTSIGCFLFFAFHLMLPGPLIYLLGFAWFKTHPEYGDWVLLWPLAGSAISLFFTP